MNIIREHLSSYNSFLKGKHSGCHNFCWICRQHAKIKSGRQWYSCNFGRWIHFAMLPHLFGCHTFSDWCSTVPATHNSFYLFVCFSVGQIWINYAGHRMTCVLRIICVGVLIIWTNSISPQKDVIKCCCLQKRLCMFSQKSKDCFPNSAIHSWNTCL